MSMWLVIVGNPANGLFFHGPFESFEDAETWAEIELHCEWWIAPLEAPQENARLGS